VSSLPKQSGNADDRSDERRKVRFSMIARTADRTEIPLLVTDLSESGFQARSAVEVAPGTTLSLTFPLARASRAEVRWMRDGEIGCRFERPIEGDDFTELLVTLWRHG